MVSSAYNHNTAVQEDKDLYVQGVPKHVSIVNFYTSNKRGKNKEGNI